ncbi:hypothetical protein F2Q69_00012661 [Brassica cretica]|uniref:Uncharacterized protein n=1 Tax=Brassica cretica TaxID=69181 RepID=A0A8S9QJH1_BRACR|nr:hypothetical protein F2Q69_00012661 [Brassica cretica]
MGMRIKQDWVCASLSVLPKLPKTHVQPKAHRGNTGYSCKSTVEYMEQKCKSPGAPNNICLSKRGKQQSLALGSLHPYQHPLNLLVTSYRSRIQHSNSIMASFRAAEYEIRTDPGQDDATMAEPDDSSTKDKPGWINGRIKNPRVIKNLRVPKQSLGPEKISGPGKGKPPGSYITPGSKRPPGPKETSEFKTTSGSRATYGFKTTSGPKETFGFKTTFGSRATSGFKTTFRSKRNLRVQKDLQVQSNLRVQNDLWVLNTTSGSEGTSGFPNNLRVLTQPPGSKCDLRV